MSTKKLQILNGFNTGSQETIIAKDANADGNIVLTNYVSDSYAEHIGDVGNPHSVTIEQIGAAPAGYGLGGSSKVIDDWNAAIANGFYRSSASCINGPVAGSQYHGMMINYSSTLGNQFVFKTWVDGVSEIWTRRYYNGEFGEWHPVLTDKNINTYAAPAGYGLGAESGRQCVDCYSVNEGGFWYVDSNTANVPEGISNGVMLVEINTRGDKYLTIKEGPYMVKCYYSTYAQQWQPWEWVNPFLYPDVEYRTIERHNSYVVYKKNIGGIIHYRLGSSSTEWKPYSDIIGAAPAGYGLGTANGRECDDFNTATEIGFYAMKGDDVKNGPSFTINFKYGALRVERRYGQIIQTATYKDTVASRYSMDSGATWSAWRRVDPPEAKTHTVTVNSSFVNSGSITANSVNGVLKVGGYLQTKAQHSSGGATTIICTIPGVKVSGNTYAVMIDHDHSAKAYNILLFTNESGNTVVQIESSSTSIAASTWLNFSVLGVLA